MKNIKKKAFTLVELLVVIAILAILASVSVVGYIGFTEKAKESNDITLVKQLNIVLASSEADGKKNQTYTEAIEDMEENGFNIEKMTPTSSKSEILWDQESDRFVLVRDNEITFKDETSKADLNKESTLWKMYDEIPDSAAEGYKNYSIYLKDSSKAYPEEVTIKTGFDAGKNKTNFKLFYDGTIQNQNVIIKTNGSDSELRVNTADSTIYHYGNLGKADIEQVPTRDCYHENGKTVYIVLTAGKLVAEPASKIEVLNVKATEASKVELVVNESAEIKKPYCASPAVQEVIKQEVEKVSVEKVEVKETAKVEEVVKEEQDKVLAEENQADLQISKQDMTNQFMSLEEFRDKVNAGNSYEGYQVKLLRSVDLTGKKWTPIGVEFSNPFSGDFDGNNKTISNLKMNHNSGKSGLFGCVVGATSKTQINALDIKSDWTPFFANNVVDETYFSEDKFVSSIKNLNIENANIDNTLNGGACNGILAGLVQNGYVENVKVTNSTIKGNKQTGGLIGYVYGTFDAKPGHTYTCTSVIKNNSVTNTTVDGSSSHTGGMVGKGYDATIALDNKVLGVKVSGNHCVGGLGGDFHYGIFNNNIVSDYVYTDTATKEEKVEKTVVTSKHDGNGSVDIAIGGLIGCIRRSSLFVNCTNNATVICNNKAAVLCVGGFVGRLDSSESKSTEFYNCINNGIIANEGCTVGEFFGKYHKDVSYQNPSPATFDEQYFHDSQVKPQSNLPKIGQNGTQQ